MTGIRKFIYGCVLSLGSLVPALGQAAMPIPAVESTSDVIRVVDIQIVCDRTGCYESRRPSRGYDDPPPGYDRGPPPGYYDRPPPGYRDPPPAITARRRAITAHRRRIMTGPHRAIVRRHLRLLPPATTAAATGLLPPAAAAGL